MDSDQDDMYGASDSEGYHDNQVEEADDEPSLSDRHHENYKTLGNAEIRKRQEDDIRRVCSVLSVPRVSATILLSHYKWSVSKVHEEWFEDDQKVRRTVGLLEKPTVDYSEFKDITCGICFDTYDYDSDKMLAAACGHLFCCSCWKGFVSTAINDGPGCLALRCPEPSCRAAVGQDIVNLVASEEDRGKYSYHLLRSYIENNRKTKWCPAPGCDYAVEFDVAGGSSDSYDVLCRCSCNFCWNCCEEVHRPVDCETVSKWILKNSSEAENTNWILAHAKPCPKCKRPIEKNKGCMHMTCTLPCKFEFCWLCLKGWKEHGSQSCNRYKEGNKQGVFDESEIRRQIARKSIAKYTHYYERWATNNSSRNKALADLRKMETVNLKTLSVKQCQAETQLIFLVEAWEQIVECRRVLKWTYAYGYYLPESELAKKHFFEYAQGEAEAGLERLHMCAEKELQAFLDSEDPTDGPVKEGSLKAFNDFRTKLTGLTIVTRDYFKKLVQALENGLSDVSNSSSSKTLVSSSREGKAGGTQKKSRKGSSSSIDDSDYWYCERCTYANVSARTICEICDQANKRLRFY